ncbi:hypothetical protein ACTHRH_06130 [Paenibacillus sp. SAFN-117]
MLELPKSRFSTAEPETVNVNDEQASGLDNQQPSSCFERMEKVQRLG